MVIMEILPIAASSLNAAATVTAVRADNIVNATTPNFTAAAPVYSSQVNGGVAVFAQDVGQPVNITLEVIGLKSALEQYKVSAALVETAVEMNKTALEIA
jgi:flagellar basal body rod protein FlgC